MVSPDEPIRSTTILLIPAGDRGTTMDDTLTDTKANLEQYATEKQLTAKAEALRQEALELLSRLAALDSAPADASREFDSVVPRNKTADRLATDLVVFGSQPESEAWIAVSPETLVSLEDCQ
jgi:hypothetical protein